MKVQFACLSLSLAVAVTALPAAAADWGVPNGGVVNGGIRDLGGAGGVPVPAPVPVSEYVAKWYLRIDGGAGTIGDVDIEEDGFVYGQNSIDGPAATRTLSSDFFKSQFNTFTSIGGGVGYYLGRGFRIDGTIEKLSDGNAIIAGSDVYDQFSFSGPPLTATPTNSKERLTVFDKTHNSRSLWLANLYYDFAQRGRFTPYIGGGIGFAWNVLTRDHHNQLDTCDSTTPLGCDAGNFTNGPSVDVRTRVDQVSFAAAASAGVSIDVRESTKLDLGYRYLYLGETNVSIAVCNTCDLISSVKLGSQNAHEFHAALRFDIE